MQGTLTSANLDHRLSCKSPHVSPLSIYRALGINQTGHISWISVGVGAGGASGVNSSLLETCVVVRLACATSFTSADGLQRIMHFPKLKPGLRRIDSIARMNGR